MNDDEEPTAPALDHQSPAIDSEPRVENQCDAVSGAADVSGGDLVAGTPIGEEIRPLLGENRDSVIAEAEAETEGLSKEDGVDEIVTSEGLSGVGEVEGMVRKDGEGEGVKEVEFGEHGDDTKAMELEAKGEDHEDVMMEEESGVNGLSVEWNAGAAGEVEAKREEGTVEEEISEAGQLLEAGEKDGELNGGDEANAVVKQDDELKGETKALMVDSCGIRENDSQTLRKKETVLEDLLRQNVGGEEIQEEKTDDYDRLLKVNARSNGKEDPNQMDETVGSLIDDSKEEVEGEIFEKDMDQFRPSGSLEPRNKDEVTQFDKSTESQLVADEGKDTVQEQETQEMDDVQSVASQDEVGGDELQGEDELPQFDEIAEPQLAAHEGKDIEGEEETQEMHDFESTASQDEVGGDNEDEVGGNNEEGGTEMEMEGEIEAGHAKTGRGGKRKRGRAAKSPGKAPQPLVGEDMAVTLFSVIDEDAPRHIILHVSITMRPSSESRVVGIAVGTFAADVGRTLTICVAPVPFHCAKHVAFDDKSQWEFLFKDYWMEQKEKLGFTAEEIAQAKNPWKGLDIDDKQAEVAGKNEASDEAGDASDSSLADSEVTNSKSKRTKKQIKSDKNVGSDSDSSSDKFDGSNTKRKAKRWLKPPLKHLDSNDSKARAITKGKKSKKLAKSHANGGNSSHGDKEWASEELLEFVLHMKNGDGSVLSQFDVQALLLEYIKQNKLRDPRRRSQIVCDPMLQKLFGKPRVGHFEMLKLLESHFLIKNDSQADDNQGRVVDTKGSQMDADEAVIASRGPKMRKKGDDKRLQSNLDDYAAIDMHNISLIYLRRNLMEALLEDTERFQEKVVGSFVRIRISGSMQKQDMYRLVQVVGTRKAAEPYKVGKRTTDLMLEILNLDKTEPVSIDTISNQEFTEDECKRLRQSIKCGLISRLTVGDVLGKAKEFHTVRVTDWLETETERLRHLCDRAKINMKSGKESFRRGSDQFSVRKGGYPTKDSWSPSGIPPQRKWESNRNLSGEHSSGRRDDATHVTETANRSLWHQGADRGSPQLNDWEKLRPIFDAGPSKYSELEVRTCTSFPDGPEPSQRSSAVIPQIDAKIDEVDKLWQYRDPSHKVQGPFSLVQLRKWKGSGFFPADLRIWKTTETEDESILLASALAGKFQKEPSQVRAGSSDIRHIGASHGLALQRGSSSVVSPLHLQNVASPSSMVTSEFSNIHSPDTTRKLDYSNLPSPTPSQCYSTRRDNSVSRWSPTIVPKQNGGNGVLRATHMVGSEATQAPRLSNPSMFGNPQQISQSTQNVQVMAHPLSNNIAASSINAIQGGTNLALSGGAQNPIAYAQGSGTVNHGQLPVNPQAWGSAGPQNSPNLMQAQQPSYGYWGNTPPTNGHSQPHGAGQFQGVGNLSNQNFSSMPSQNQWRPQVPVNTPWGAATPENQGAGAPPSSNAAWGSMPTNSNMGWAGQTPGMAVGPLPSSGQVAGQVPGPPAMTQSGSSNVGWLGPVNGNPGWVAPGGNPGGTWGSEQNRSSTPPNAKGQGVCRFHENGYCKKGASSTD
ncbi:Zinc finger CCCH domain-containing protein [Drosera capensis]